MKRRNKPKYAEISAADRRLFVYADTEMFTDWSQTFLSIDEFTYINLDKIDRAIVRERKTHESKS